MEDEFIDGISAPFVKNSSLKIGLKLREVIHLGINKTEFVIGEVICVDVSENHIEKDGYIDIESLSTVGVTGLDAYHEIKKPTRLSYAKPGQLIKEI